MRFRLSTLLLAVAVVAAVLFVVENVQTVVWVGSFPLQVDLRGADDRRIIEVAAEPLERREYADYVRTDPNKLELYPERVDWADGQSFTVPIRCSGRRSGFGRELSYAQFELLVLRITFADGEVEWIAIEIPDGRKSREVTVTLAERK